MGLGADGAAAHGTATRRAGGEARLAKAQQQHRTRHGGGGTDADPAAADETRHAEGWHQHAGTEREDDAHPAPAGGGYPADGGHAGDGDAGRERSLALVHADLLQRRQRLCLPRPDPRRRAA